MSWSRYLKPHQNAFNPLDLNAIKMVRVEFGQDMESGIVAALDYRIELFKATDVDYVMGCFEQDSRTYERIVVEKTRPGKIKRVLSNQIKLRS